MAHETIFNLDRLKYLKWSAGLVVLCVTVYALHSPPIKAGGGTWLGYTLGTIGALLILWLLLFGVRKRAYSSNLGSLRSWLSAHVYLGLALAVVATLHTGFEFGWNIHTLAYALTLAVILSGVWGVILYLRHPLLMSNLLDGKTLQQHGQVLGDIDSQCLKLAETLSPEIKSLVSASARAALFDSFSQRLRGKNLACVTQSTLTALEKMSEGHGKELQEIRLLQFRRIQQLHRIRTFIRHKTWAEIWLLFHVPLSFALLASLLAHTVSVFFYW